MVQGQALRFFPELRDILFPHVQPFLVLLRFPDKPLLEGIELRLLWQGQGKFCLNRLPDFPLLNELQFELRQERFALRLAGVLPVYSAE